MLTVLALAMIVLFIVLLSAKKLSVFASLTLVPLVFGLIAIAATNHGIMDLFAWIEKGIYFSADPDTGKVSWGVISPAMTILFSILYFDIMLGVGLFDPVAEFFIKKAKGRSLKGHSLHRHGGQRGGLQRRYHNDHYYLYFCFHQPVPADESEAQLPGNRDCGSHRHLEHASLGRAHHRLPPQPRAWRSTSCLPPFFLACWPPRWL